MSNQNDSTTQKPKVIDFTAFKSKQDFSNELTRGRKPLFVDHDTGKISGTSDGTKHLPAQDDFGDRLFKIRASLERINSLMADLKKLSTQKDAGKIN